METLNKPALLLKSIVPLLKDEYMSVIDVGSRGVQELICHSVTLRLGPAFDDGRNRWRLRIGESK